MFYLTLFLKTKISINAVLQLKIASDTLMSVERLLSAHLMVEISLYI